MTTQPTPPATAPSAEPVAFANEIINIAFEGGNLDGAEIQDIAVKHGLLTIQTMTEACGEHCNCQANDADFPTECYRKTYPPTDLRAELDAMTAERDKLRGELRFTEMFHENRASELLADRDKWKQAHADTLAELRKVSEELGALKGERAEMEKDAGKSDDVAEKAKCLAKCSFADYLVCPKDACTLKREGK